RINAIDTPFCKEDLEAIIPLLPDAIRLPKTSSVEDIMLYEKLISEIEEKNKIEIGTTKIVPMLETAVAIENAYEIARSSSRIIAITIGGEDLTADMKVARTREGHELYWARAKVALAASAAKVAALDTVYSDVNDEEGLRKDTIVIKELGFDGKACINPRQIQIIHEVFNPSDQEIEKAIEIIKASRKKEGGVVSLNGRMIDYPVVKRAEITLTRAGIDPSSI
ncbi:MAG: HpcH/HpaI aldolase/citrate lyase family protein, partial [Exilispira sp.]